MEATNQTSETQAETEAPQAIDTPEVAAPAIGAGAYPVFYQSGHSAGAGRFWRKHEKCRAPATYDGTSAAGHYSGNTGTNWPY